MSRSGGSPPASSIPFTPTGSIAATDVQAAIAEVATEASAGATEFATGSGLTLSGTHTTTLGTETWRTTIGTLTANHVETIAGRAAGKFVLLRVVQDGTGGRTLSISDGTTPTSVTINSTAAAPTDILVICPNSTDIDVIVLGGSVSETDPNAVLKSLIDAAGDLIVGSADNTPARLAKGADGTVLTVTAGSVGWATPDATQTELDAKADKTVTINDQTGTSYTLVLGDAGKVVRVSNAGTHTLTVPPNSSVAFPTGTVVNVARAGAGAVNVAAGGGVTINSPGGVLGLRVQYSQATLLKVATDTWLLGGDIA